MRQVGSALDAAHAAGILHRDVKPENILMCADDFAYLVDFGIASATTDDKLTQIGTTVDTAKYMAPERFGESEVTHRADIYALTCVLYECLTGSPPYLGDQLSVAGAHLHQAIPRVSAARPGIPAAFDDVIARGMAKDPADRYATCGDLTVAAHAALAAPDQDRATDILARSQVARLPAVPAGPPPAAFVPGPPVGAAPTGWGGAPVWTNAGTGAPPWGPPPRAGRKPWLWVGVAATVAVAVVGVALVVPHPWRSASPTAPTGTAGPPTPPPDTVTLRVLDDGVFVGSSAAAATIDIFNEPICPPCGGFIRSNAAGIDAAVNNKKLAVRTTCSTSSTTSRTAGTTPLAR